MAELKSDFRASPAMPATCAFLLFAIFKFLQVTYRLYLHPLSNFPGPRAAKTSRSWLWQHVSSGHAEQALAKAHRDHGNTEVLRVAPNQLHITDVSAYKTIYSQTDPFPKEPSFYSCFSIPHSLFAEHDPALHKQRHKLLNPLFSRASIAKLEPVMVEKMQEMGAKIRHIVNVNANATPMPGGGAGDDGSDGSNGWINITNMVRCVTSDVVGEFAFGRPLGLLGERPDEFGAGFLDAFDAAAAVPFRLYYSSALQRLLLSFLAAPPLIWIACWLDPAMAELARLTGVGRDAFYAYAKRTDTTAASHPVVFDALRSVPEAQQLTEAMDVLIAGSDTTAYTLATGLYHILRRPEMAERLAREVREAVPDGEALLPFAQLEKIEYLRACIKESLRVAMPVPGVLPRIVPARPQPFTVDGKIIPAGTIVGMSAYTMHYSEELWGKDAQVFNPERWLGPAGKHLDAYLCTFSKGARQCIGINLAHTEATMAMAYLFRNFRMELKSTEFRHQDTFTQQVLDPGVLVKFAPL